MASTDSCGLKKVLYMNIRNTKIPISSVTQLRLDNPTWTLNEIGQQVGLTRERIRQILKHNNFQTKAINKYPTLKCARCQKLITTPKGYTLHVKPDNTPGKRYCSVYCRQFGKYDYYSCNYCKKLIWMSNARYKIRTTRNKTFHCSKKCNGFDLWERGLFKSRLKKMV